MMVQWADVMVGDYVKDPSDVVWKITDERRGSLTLNNRTGFSVALHRPAPGTVVELVYRPTTEQVIKQMAEQIQLVEQDLGGRVIESNERVEAFSDMTPASQSRHLWVHHANASTGLSSQTMENLHEVLHQQPLNERQHHHVNPGERIVIV